MIITISGTPGSGKSTIAKILERDLKAERIYVGQIMRENARKQNKTLQQYIDEAQKNPSIDKEIDNQVARLALQKDERSNIIIVEGRIQFHLLHKSIKVFITVSPEIGANRIYEDLKNNKTNTERNEGNPQSIDQVLKATIKRMQEDKERLLKLYEVDYLNPKNYDLVIDTGSITAQEAADQLKEYLA